MTLSTTVELTPSILMIDDDDVDAMLVRRAIKKAEMDVMFHAVEDGALAVDCLRGTGPFACQEPVHADLILLDINMPLMDGFKTIDILKSESDLRSIPIVFLTTSSRQADVSTAYRAGAASYITKPSGFSPLIKLVADLGAYWFDTVVLTPAGQVATQQKLDRGD